MVGKSVWTGRPPVAPPELADLLTVLLRSIRQCCFTKPPALRLPNSLLIEGSEGIRPRRR